jgi:hypothetical protein
MEGVKSALSSQTIWGAATAALASGLGLFGYAFSGADQATATMAVTSVVSAVFSLYAIYGRIVASKRIG